MFFAVPFFYFCFRKKLMLAGTQEPVSCPDPKEAIKSKKSFTVSCAIFGLAVILLITHAQTGLTVSCIVTLVGVITLVAAGGTGKKLLKQVDWDTLLFFIGLFVVISGLEQTGVLEILAMAIGKAGGGSALTIIAIILWGSAVASAFVDNIPFAATMIPVIRSLSVTEGIDLPVLAWTLSMGTDIGGNATPIGASANVVGTSIAAKNGHHISWGRYCRSMAPATILVIAISMAVIFVRYF
jgi:Na+/H+ antiporter NhaD/arsenite permease-like protein